jgi:hypothetical protein
LLGPFGLCFYPCESENIEDKYLKRANGPDSLNNQPTKGELAWLPLNGNLKDSSGNNIPVLLVGNTQFTQGLNEDYGQGLYLDGKSYLVLHVGYYDTLSVVLWIKGEGGLERENAPVLFDYGLNTLSAQLDVDGTTGATNLRVKKNEDMAGSHENKSVEYLNSFTQYSLLYMESGGDKTKVYFKGYSSGHEIVYSDEFNFPGNMNAKTDLLYIGRSSQRANQENSYFKGAIDEVRIYNKTLTNTEIEALASIPAR